MSGWRREQSGAREGGAEGETARARGHPDQAASLVLARAHIRLSLDSLGKFYPRLQKITGSES
jgi:hypothetical protein